VVVFVSFLLLSHAAMPDIKDGEYVLNSHGRITGYISEKDYFLAKGLGTSFICVWLGMSVLQIND